MQACQLGYARKVPIGCTSAPSTCSVVRKLTVGPFQLLSALTPNRLFPSASWPHDDSSAACAMVKEAGIPVARWQACAGPVIRAMKALGGMVGVLHRCSVHRIGRQAELRRE